MRLGGVPEGVVLLQLGHQRLAEDVEVVLAVKGLPERDEEAELVGVLLLEGLAGLVAPPEALDESGLLVAPDAHTEGHTGGDGTEARRAERRHVGDERGVVCPDALAALVHQSADAGQRGHGVCELLSEMVG